VKLTEQYELRECLWKVLSKDQNQNKKKDAWQGVSFHTGIDVGIVGKKIKSFIP
jgi:hypothetical protein